jgi:drug/metabolite transporter (DMT)-like permease
MGTAGQLLWTRALKLGDVSALTPISFMQLPLVTFAGWLLFDEAVGANTLIGAAIILASTFYIAHREAVLARQSATRAPSEAKLPGE